MKRYFWFLGGTLVLLMGVWILFAPNVRNEQISFFIPKNATFPQLMDSLGKYDVLKNQTTFKIASKVMLYRNVRTGKYVMDKGMSNFDLLMMLRKGQHYPVKFTFNNVRTKEQLMNKLSKYYFLFEWQDLYQLLNDQPFLGKYQLTPETVMAIFIPNTYEFYYDITAVEFFEKMFHYYQEFWNEERMGEAEAIGFTPLEVVTLASIVEEENFREKEKAIIAGLYINRLRADMPLQADPTIKFAVGDFSIKRVLNEHLTVESPYNTYKYKGLPPGPIRIPTPSTVDSVLHYTHHNYMYMCAKEDFSGTHNFTNNYQEHLRNAAKYRAALSAISQ